MLNSALEHKMAAMSSQLLRFAAIPTTIASTGMKMQKAFALRGSNNFEANSLLRERSNNRDGSQPGVADATIDAAANHRPSNVNHQAKHGGITANAAAANILRGVLPRHSAAIAANSSGNRGGQIGGE